METPEHAAKSAVPDTPELREVESPPPEAVLDGVPSAAEVIDDADSAEKILSDQPSVEEVLGRRRDRSDERRAAS